MNTRMNFAAAMAAIGSFLMGAGAAPVPVFGMKAAFARSGSAIPTKRQRNCKTTAGPKRPGKRHAMLQQQKARAQ